MAERPRRIARLQTWLFAGIVLGVVLSILGPRWTLIDRNGIDLPTWDEWDAQGLHALVPWFQHRPLLPELLTRGRLALPLPVRSLSRVNCETDADS